MAGIRNCEFRREAVRIALISGLAGHQVELDPGAGLSTIGIWILVISKVKEVLNGKPIFSGKLDGCKETGLGHGFLRQRRALLFRRNGG